MTVILKSSWTNKYLIYILERLYSSSIKYFSYTPNKILRIHLKLAYFQYIFRSFQGGTLLKFCTLVDQIVVDRIDLHPRQWFMYNVFLSPYYNYRIISNVNYSITTAINSLNQIFPNSTWSEREIKEMFGCLFNNLHDDRRLLTDYGFLGFCLRKDFPLSGYVETRYDDEVNALIIEPLELSQDYRLFILKNVWESNND